MSEDTVDTILGMGPEQGKAELNRHDEVRAAVRDALPGLLHQKPFKDLTIDEIAGAAGLTRTAFYFYFKNKTEVLSALLMEIATDLLDATDAWWSGEGPPEQLVREALEGSAQIYFRYADVLRVAIEVTSYDVNIAALYKELTNRFVASSSAHIRREQEAGRCRNVDPVSMAESLVWMTERCNHMFICIEGRDPAAVVDAQTAIWVHALYPDDAVKT